MCNEIVPSIRIPRDILDNLVNVICENTNLSIGLVERGVKPKTIIPPESRSNFTDLCRTIWETEYGKQKCEDDHIKRAEQVNEEAPTVCHAGLINLAIPIEIAGGIKAVLLCGQRRPKDTGLKAEAKSNFEEFISGMSKNAPNEWSSEYEQHIRDVYNSTEMGSVEDLRRLTEELSTISSWIYWAHEELTNVNKEKVEVKKAIDDALQAAKFLVHDMAEPLQRLIDICSLLYHHASSSISPKKSLRNEVKLVKNEIEGAKNSLKNVHQRFSYEVRPPEKKQFSKAVRPISVQVLGKLLDVFCKSSELAIGLFERTGVCRTIMTEVAKKNFTSYCKTIWSFEKGKQKCDTDHAKRAKSIDAERLSLCHAGLHNYGIPIRFEGKTVACLLCGQWRVVDSIEKAEENHETMISALCQQITEQRKDKLTDTLRKQYESVDVKSGEFPHLQKFRNLASLYGWMYSAHEEFIKSLDERNKTIDEFQSIIDEEKLLYHDIVQLEIQALMDVFASLQHTVREFPLSIESEVNDKTGDMLDILDGAKHRLWFSKAAQFAWKKSQTTRIDLVEVMERCITELNASARRKSVVFQFNQKPVGGIPLIGNYYQMYIALWNILHNAVKYSHRGFHRLRGIEVCIWVTTENSKFRICVENFGVGILEHESKSIYLPGKRGEIAKRERPHGAGRGLYEALTMLSKNKCILSHVSKEVSKGRYLTKFSIDVPKT